MRKYPLKKTERIKKTTEFEKIYKEGTTFKDNVLVLKVLPNESGHPRFGISVSKKIGSAVRRNRIKRLFREAFRLNKPSLPLDVIMIPNKSKETFELKEIEESLKKLVKKFEKDYGNIRAYQTH